MNTPRHKITIIVATATDGAIGTGGDMPFRISADLRRFRQITTGHPVVMGRKTFLSIGRPLPGRTNIVISSNPDFRPEGTIRAASLDEAISLASKAEGGDNIMIIGGGSVYSQALPLADTLELTEVDATYPDAEVRFPDISLEHWRVAELEPWLTDEPSGLRYRFITLNRLP